MFNRISRGVWWDRAWTLTRGCTPVSAACDNCWAAKEAHMRQKHPNLKVQLAYCGLTDDAGKWVGKVRTVEASLDLPLRARKPAAWAVWNDLFHEDVPDEFITRAFTTMSLATRHKFLILTKRADRMAKYFAHGSRYEFLVPNVWLGVTAENQEQADKRIPFLIGVQAAVRFVSIEPMLGPVGLPSVKFDRYTRMDVLSGCGISQRAATQSIPNAFCEPLAWVICGGETGAGGRVCDPQWVRRLRDDCGWAKVPFFFKGWGKCGPPGRLLDGCEWNEVPRLK